MKLISVCKPIRLRLTFPKREEALCPLVVGRINGKVGGNAVDSYYIVIDTGIFYLCSLDCDSRTVLKLLYTDKLVVADIDKPVVFENKLAAVYLICNLDMVVYTVCESIARNRQTVKYGGLVVPADGLIILAQLAADNSDIVIAGLAARSIAEGQVGGA